MPKYSNPRQWVIDHGCSSKAETREYLSKMTNYEKKNEMTEECYNRLRLH